MKLFHQKVIGILAAALILFFEAAAMPAVEANDIKGFVRDANSGEALPFANITLKGTRRGTATNADGYFVLVNVPLGQCVIVVHYIGYDPVEIRIDNRKGHTQPLKVELKPTVIEVGGITVTAQAEMVDAGSRKVSQLTLSPQQLSSLPNIGEIDVFRTMQLLPGISGVSDGSSGLYVRGGTPDQNLVLFDGMTIYHVDHFFGFFSAFNADAIKDIQIIKGGFPAEYGGRISSVVNLTGKTGDHHKRQFGYGLNLLSGHIGFETPLFNDRATLLIAGRRSYTDFIQSPLYDKIYGMLTGDDEGTGRTGGPMQGGRQFGNQMQTEFKPSFYFYDFNSKLTWNASPENIFTLSFYSGKDNLDKSQDYQDMAFRFGGSEDNTDVSMNLVDLTSWGNTGLSSKWSYQWADRFHTDIQVAWSEYFSSYDRNRQLDRLFIPANDSLSNARGFAFASQEDNSVNDFTFRADADWHVAESHVLKLGLHTSLFQSDYTALMNDTTQVLDRGSDGWQYSAFVQDNWRIKALELTFGLRSSYYEPTEKLYYEPRAAFTMDLTKKIQLKGAWGQYYQFVNRIANENVLEGSRDFWLLSDENIQPAFSEHNILGISYENDRYLLSAEAYYKDLDNIVEFSRRVRPEANYDQRFFVGAGEAKGIEFLVQKKRGMLTGWIGYTLGKVEHQFSAFNDGNPFPADHDRRHEVNVVSKYTWGVWSFSATWVYASGKAYTAPESQYFIPLLNGDVYSYIHVSDKNANRLPDYQRLDLSVSRKYESQNWETEIGISIFNAYNHKNVWYREYNLDTTPITVTDAVMLGMTPTLYLQMKLK